MKKEKSSYKRGLYYSCRTVLLSLVRTKTSIYWVCACRKCTIYSWKDSWVEIWYDGSSSRISDSIVFRYAQNPPTPQKSPPLPRATFPRLVFLYFTKYTRKSARNTNRIHHRSNTKNPIPSLGKSRDNPRWYRSPENPQTHQKRWREISKRRSDLYESGTPTASTKRQKLLWGVDRDDAMRARSWSEADYLRQMMRALVYRWSLWDIHSYRVKNSLQGVLFFLKLYGTHHELECRIVYRIISVEHIYSITTLHGISIGFALFSS